MSDIILSPGDMFRYSDRALGYWGKSYFFTKFFKTLEESDTFYKENPGVSSHYYYKGAVKVPIGLVYVVNRVVGERFELYCLDFEEEGYIYWDIKGTYGSFGGGLLTMVRGDSEESHEGMIQGYDGEWRWL